MADSSAKLIPEAKESRSQQVVIIQLTMLSLASLAVIDRIWVRLALVNTRLAADDWVIMISLAFSVAFVADVVTRECFFAYPLYIVSPTGIILTAKIETKYGLGQHVADLPKETNFAESLRVSIENPFLRQQLTPSKLFYFGEAIYYITVGTTKVAILLLYLRLAVKKGLRTLIWATMGFVIATFVASVIAGLFQCNPIAFAWNKNIEGGTCFNVTALFYANAGLNIFQDVFIYILLMQMLWEIQIPRKQKIALIAVFAVGGFVCVTGMLRLNSLKTASVSQDPTCKYSSSVLYSSRRSAYRSKGTILVRQSGLVSSQISASFALLFHILNHYSLAIALD